MARTTDLQMKSAARSIVFALADVTGQEFSDYTFYPGNSSLGYSNRLHIEFKSGASKQFAFSSGKGEAYQEMRAACDVLDAVRYLTN